MGGALRIAATVTAGVDGETVMTMPDFFILGAPKCGTTALAHWLGEHPQVYMSAVKEPHYFSTDLANRSITSRERYERLFREAKPEHLAVGEASTWYLFSREAVPNIQREYPNVRYIVMTRDPVEMAESLYYHNVRNLHEDQPTFEKAWQLQGQRSEGKCIPADCVEPAFLQYKAACSLGSQLEELLGMVGKERVLHIALEDVRTNPQQEYQRVLAFLELPDDGRTRFLPANEARANRSRLLRRLIRIGGRARRVLGIHRGFGLARLNERRLEKGVLSPAFQAELEQAFEGERQQLRDIAYRLESGAA